MTVSIWQADGAQPVREVDFLIVGAGLVGCAAAWFAAQAGRTVVITEARDLALGASSRNVGFMITGLESYYHQTAERFGAAAAREIWALSRATHAHWRRWAQAGGVQLDECGSLRLAESAAEARDLEQAARALEADGLPVEYLSSDPLGRGYHAAIRQPQDAAVQPYALVRAIYEQSGAELVANNEVYHTAQDGNTALVYTRQTVFRARHALLCVNAYAPLLDPYFVGKIIPTRGQCLATAPLPGGPVIGTCGYSDYGSMYYRDTFDGRLLIGGGRKQNVALEDNTTEDRVTEPVQRVLEDYLRARFPDISAPIERRWSGIMGFSADGLPLVGTLPGRPRVGFAVGFHGHGLALGAETAARAVDLLLTGADPGVLNAARLAG